MDFVYVVLGLLLLFGGGEALIRGSVAVSERFGISPVLIGVVIVGFGTSTPELLVSVQASLAGSPEIALGNIVGSNIANVMLILAMAAIITPLACRDVAIRRDSLVVIAASLAVIFAATLGEVARVLGALMIAALAAYVFYSYRADQKQKAALAGAEVLHEREVHAYENEKPMASLPLSLGMAIGGIVVLMIGARLLVDGATNIARGYGVSEAIIGLSLVAVGTSLPELAAGVIGAIRKQTDMVVGNILGSNMYNILGILGIASVIKPIPVDGRMAALDIPIMLGVAVLTTAVVFGLKVFGRGVGLACLVLYIAYVWWMFASGQPQAV